MTRLFLATAVLAVAIAFAPIAGIEALMQTGAVQTGAVQTGAVQTGAVQTGTVQTGTVQTRPAPTGAGDTNASAGTSPQALLATYCYSCHNTRVQMGGLALQGLDIKAVEAHAEVWEKAVRKLRGRLMPPPGSPQPAQQDIDAFVAWMENTLDANPRVPKAGYVGLQRLSRIEYAAAVKALVGVDIVAKDVLPQDAAVDGFDNIASALKVSPTFMEQYVEAARTIAKKAIGDRSLDSTSYAAAAHRGVEAMPLGLRDGGMRLKHNFPVDGEYRFNILFPDQTLGLYTASLENEATLVLMIDGKVMFKKPIGGLNDLMLNNRKAGDGRQQIADRFRNVSLPIQAGVREVVVGFIDRSRFESLGFQGGGGGGLPSFNSIEIKGPYNPTGAVSTAGRKLLYVCDPKAAGDAPCAKQIAENLVRRAFRRPVTGADLARLMPFYEAGRKEGDFDRGIERLVAAVLVSPDFLYRAIRGAQPSKAGAEHQLTDFELATRLSFFLWNTGPDDELFRLAASGELGKPAVMNAQVTRMLADPKASSLVTNFAMKWLGLDGLDGIKPDEQIYTNFNDALRQDLVAEAQAFILSVLLENRPIVELLTSDRTYLNDRVARHYGIAGVNGAQFRWVTLTDRNRMGLLGKGAVLMSTSYPDRTSPVLRGAWVLEKIIGTPPTPPPPGVESNLSQRAGETPRTVRARLEQHRENAACRQCHGVIDPMGLALENFDAVGQFRTVDRQAANAPIDASTVLPSGLAIDGPIELREYLAANAAKFAQAFTEKLMMYAVNRELEYFDMPQVRAVVRGAAKDQYTLSSIVQGIVRSDAFLKQGGGH
jgi:mono/diheme cytochrome c family protein